MNQDIKKIDFKGTVANPLQFVVRDEAIIMEAWDPTTNVLDLEKINNHFEFFTIIGNIIKINSSKSIDEYWNKDSWPEFKTYLSSIVSSNTFKFKFKGQVSTEIPYDFASSLKRIINGFDNYKEQRDSPNEHDQNRGFDVELEGLNSNLQPIEFNEVATIGGPLLDNLSVRALVSYDSNFALSLSKLVNIPKDSFEGFKDLMFFINKFFNFVFRVPSLQEWINEKGVDLKINSDGQYEKINLPDVDLFKALSLYVMLKPQII